MASFSESRAKEAFKFLKDEIPHCEDMLMYLNEEDKVKSLQQSVDQGEIDISLLTFKIGKNSGVKNSKHQSEPFIYHTLNTDSLKSQPQVKKRLKKNMKMMNKDVSKPNFKKLKQVNWFDIVEVEEQDSSFCSTDLDDKKCSRNTNNQIKDVGRRTISSSEFKVKSPSYQKRTEAQKKIKMSILNWYTKKAKSVLRDIKRIKHQKALSCSTIRDKYGLTLSNERSSISRESNSNPFDYNPNPWNTSSPKYLTNK